MPQKRINSLNKALDIFELFAKTGAPLNVKEISNHIKLPESTLYRYISTLFERGYIEYDPSTQKYCLGINLLKLRCITANQQEIYRIALPIMEDLARKAGETVLLTIRRGNNAVVLEVVLSGQSGVKLAMNRGDSLPLYSCALTRPLIAYLSDSEIDSILKANPPRRFTDHTITDVQQIKAELKKVRRQDYSYSDQEVTVGARGLGAPVFNYSGTVIATLCLAGAVHNFTKSKIPTFVNLLLKATEQCSIKMGFEP
jgi:IclR family KDG regulon transcriptional repressor